MGSLRFGFVFDRDRFGLTSVSIRIASARLRFRSGSIWDRVGSDSASIGVASDGLRFLVAWLFKMGLNLENG